MDLPQPVKNTLWSYDLNKIDLQKDRGIIIFNTLNFGTQEAVLWLQNTYSKNEILESIAESNTRKWSVKSLNYWSIYFSVLPKNKNRFT